MTSVDAHALEVAALTKKLAAQKAEIERLRTALTYTGTELGKAREEIERLTDELINVEQVAKDRYCKMQSEIERLTALRKEDREDMQRLSDQLDYLSDENAKLQADAEALQLARNKLDRCEGCGQIWAFGHQCDL